MARKQNAPAAQDWRCAWERHGERCGNAGSISNSVLGGGPWFCREHFLPLPPRDETGLKAAKARALSQVLRYQFAEAED